MTSETLLTKSQEEIKRPFTELINLSGHQAMIVNQEFGLRLKYVSRKPIAHVFIFCDRTLEIARNSRLATENGPTDSQQPGIGKHIIKLNFDSNPKNRSI